MIEESYNAFVGIVKEMQRKMRGIIKDLEQQYNQDAIIAIQQSIMNFGNEAEDAFHLENSEFIRNLQTCCELCYEFYQSGGGKTSILDDLQREIMKWRVALEHSIQIENRKLSLVVIIRNESDYIEEWLAYHFMIGVSHVYIYDNESKDDIRQKIDPYIKSGQITYTWWPGVGVQRAAYYHAVTHYKFDTVYMGFIDADEFLLPAQDVDLLKEIEKTFELCEKNISKAKMHCGGIGVNWRVYGTSGHKQKPEGLVIENYKYRAEDFNSMNAQIKTICNPRTILSCGVHSMDYINGYCCTSENGSFILDQGLFFDGIASKLRVNHYYTKSEEEFIQRLKKGKRVCDANFKVLADAAIQNKLQKARNELNKIYDPIMERYISEVKKQLQRSIR